MSRERRDLRLPTGGGCLTLVGIVVVLVLLATTGCARTIDQAWVRALEKQVEPITTEYLEYVAADDTKSDAQKANREQAVVILRKHIDAQKE